MKTLAKALFYGALDLCTAGQGVERTINGTPIRFPARWSRFYPARYEPAKCAFLSECCVPGGVALDIGAHIGLFSVFMARLVGPSGRVFSFEPTPFTRDVLHETVRLNGCEGIVQVRPEAVSSTSGSATFYDTGDQASNANSLVPGGRARALLPVETVSVDDFAAARDLTVQCLKIDVEGAELEVLRGASRTIRVCRPAIVFELHPEALARDGASVHDLCLLLQEYDFIPFLDNRPIDFGWLSAQEEPVEIEALPREKTFDRS